ncbi:MAG: efflux RND transporter periplasmic adaptor subunit [Oscillibacter sp.]|nr:efflux RND transporter periplasmic adaptor subunit [Oscillibacter sp.]
MKPIKRSRFAAVLLAAVLTFSLAACGGQEPEADVPEEAGVAVQIQPVAEDAIATENKVSGKVSADNEYTILITSAAKCTAVYAKAGDQVQAGDILCTLDLGSALASYNAARISYSSALQSYNDQKAVLDKQVQLALDNVNNTKALFEIGAASQLEVDQAELNYQSASAGRNATLSQLEAGIQNAQSGVEQLDIALEDVDSNGNVIAPISGTLATFSAVENSFISNTMPLAVIDGPDQMKVSVSVSEALVPKLSPGDEASVYVSAIDREFTAVIRSVEQAANMQTQLYTVVLTVPADVGGLMNGMFADVTFHTDVSENAIVIPTEAILNDGSVQYVFIEENGTAKYVEITTGLTGNGVTEVLSGLAAGQSLVTVGQEYLTDGAAVRVVSLEG